MKFNKGVTGIPVLNGGYSIEIGYVILPAGVERDNFIDTCDKNLRVSVMIDRNNAVIHNCLVTEQVYQYLKSRSQRMSWVLRLFWLNLNSVKTTSDSDDSKYE